MLHPILQAFHDAYAERWADLTIEARYEDGGYLHLFWRISEHFGHNITAYVEQDDPEVYFESAVGTVSQRPEALVGAVAACAEILDDRNVPRHDDNGIEPGSFGALVWTERHRLRLAEIERERAALLDSIARMNPTTEDAP